MQRVRVRDLQMSVRVCTICSSLSVRKISREKRAFARLLCKRCAQAAAAAWLGVQLRGRVQALFCA